MSLVSMVVVEPADALSSSSPPHATRPSAATPTTTNAMNARLDTVPLPLLVLRTTGRCTRATLGLGSAGVRSPVLRRRKKAVLGAGSFEQLGDEVVLGGAVRLDVA